MTEFDQSTTERSIVAIVIAFLCIIGLFVYTLFFGAVFHTANIRRNPFFQIACVLAVSDIVTLLNTLFYAVPNLVDGGEDFSTIPGFIISLCWFSSSPLLALLSINRYIVICRSHSSDRFSVVHTRYCLLGVVAICLSSSLPTVTQECLVHFDVQVFSWGYNVERFGAYVMSWFDLAYSIFFVGISIVLNTIVFRYIIDKRNQVRIMETEKQLFELKHH